MVNQLERTGGQVGGMTLGIEDFLDTGEEQKDRAGGKDHVSRGGFGGITHDAQRYVRHCLCSNNSCNKCPLRSNSHSQSDVTPDYGEARKPAGATAQQGFCFHKDNDSVQLWVFPRWLEFIRINVQAPRKPSIYLDVTTIMKNGGETKVFAAACQITEQTSNPRTLVRAATVTEGSTQEKAPEKELWEWQVLSCSRVFGVPMDSSLPPLSPFCLLCPWNISCPYFRDEEFYPEREEEMGRRQCKNSSNNLQGNMTSPESRDHETRRIEHPTPEEIEEIDSKQNFMKIIEELKQEVKICRKEMEDKYNKKFEEMSKSINETLGNQEKTIKQAMETVQDLKIEIEAMKKTQTEGRLAMENLEESQVHKNYPKESSPSVSRSSLSLDSKAAKLPGDRASIQPLRSPYPAEPEEAGT
ncbi:hypothetical protein U0070_015083 [Myodes glareolus]|uniref:Uncharacterized protein n=1 Tax=Myodes glareolus TaxID=447135 RepID=A0AAW0JZC9_MYOGA